MVNNFNKKHLPSPLDLKRKVLIKGKTMVEEDEEEDKEKGNKIKKTPTLSSPLLMSLKIIRKFFCYIHYFN